MMLPLKHILFVLLIVAGMIVAAGWMRGGEQDPLVENAATSPATLTQLATSSPYSWGTGWVRPVMQRGMYFGAPRWYR